MRTQYNNLRILVLAALTLSAELRAQTSVNIVTTSVPFLRISPDARAGGMGDLGIATSPDINAVYINAAKIPFTKKNGGFGFNYSPWLSDLGLNNLYLAGLSYYTKTGTDNNQVFFGNLRYFSLGNMQFTDFMGNQLGSYKPREFALDFGYSRKIAAQLSMGFSFRIINSSVATGAATNGLVYSAGKSVAANLSLYHYGEDKNGEGINWGIAIANLGSKISYTNDANNKDFIPANLGIGVTYSKLLEANSKLTFGMDINKLLVPAAPELTGNNALDIQRLNQFRNSTVMGSWFKSFGDGTAFASSLQYSLGAEFLYNQQFALRTGYFHQNRSTGATPYFTAGIGIKRKEMSVDLSYLLPSGSGIARNPLSNTIRLGMILDINKEKF